MIKKNDFIELEFVAKTKEGEIFDTNIKKEAEKANLKLENPKPFIFSVGHGMIIKGLDKYLEGKEIGKSYTEEFPPEDAFGKRNAGLVRMISLSSFRDQKVVPQKGMQFVIDGRLVKIISVSGGRVLADFNNPLAGKSVIYNFKINRKIDDINEKINALQDFFFKKRFDYIIKDNDLIIKIPKSMETFVNLFSKNFKELLNLNIKVKIISGKKEEEK